MSKYVKLTTFLASYDAGIWEPTFSEIEEVLGFPLPASARQYQAWWSNQMRAQSIGWQSAGWKTSSVDLEKQRVTFVYVEDRDESDNETPQIPHLTIGDAKIGLANSFGVKPEQIEITIRA
ncbi:MAG: hypothetical protein R3E11_02760 [Sphingobium sp.]|nr:hypothetical protein [Sphingobium sp.]MCP5398413.1 hypothetical protein [Sphingomonas sp.]